MSNQPNTSHEKPRTVQDIINDIKAKSKGGGYIYRGERKCNPKVSSKLYRDFDIENEYFDIEIVQKEMLAAAKKHIGYLPQGFRLEVDALPNVDGKSTEEAIDFEILTELQHYGGKTNLIDFTTDYCIALFFACDGEPEKDGRVILQKIDKIRGMIAHPRNPRHRVIAQKSVFIRPPRGFIKPCKNHIVCIPARLKEDMLKHLRDYHGISTEVIYNDLHGFILNQHIHGGAYTHFYRGLGCGDRADETPISKAKKLEYEKAIKHYTEAIKLKPDLVEAYNNRGNIYSKKGEFEKAIEDHSRAIQFSPHCARMYNNRGAAYLDKGDFDDAIKNFDKAIELDSDNADAYINRGNVCLKKGEFGRAIEDYDTAIQLNPYYTEAYNNRGAAYFEKGEFGRAIEDYDTAIQLNPHDVDAYIDRGTTYIAKEEFGRAIEDYDTATQLQPCYTRSYINRIIIWLLFEDWKEVRDDLNLAQDNGLNIRPELQRSWERFAPIILKTDTQLPADIAALLTQQ